MINNNDFFTAIYLVRFDSYTMIFGDSYFKQNRFLVIPE